ncbi:MAG: hypothetical protein IRZ16_21295 [Myxococcaceae bacterium]|nr:hypothetical protein [Myxococcaceae bacterium]
MNRAHLFAVPLCLFAFCAVVAGCNCGGVSPADDGGVSTGEDGGQDGGLVADGGVGDGGDDGGVGVPGDGGTPVQTDAGTCYTAACAGKIYACGNCLDDDHDGLIDSADPDCLGPCHNREDSFDLGIPGGGHGNCGSIECYYDPNSGSGNDNCIYDLTCDPLEPVPACPFSGKRVGETAACPATQPQACLDVCRAITPNGCDCFGCCTVMLADGGTRDIFLGSEEATGTKCTLENAGDPSACRACTPNPSCFKECGTCQLCLGKDTVPPECVDGGAGGDGGSQQCPGGQQPCGLPGQADCPPGWYCLTGCCIGGIN